MDKGTTLQVLDHGYVKFIDSMGSDESIIEAARMSTGRGFEGWEKDANLLDFLWRNKHATPFEMCELAIEVQAPIMVFREWHRHRTQSFNEFSARYSQMPNLHYIPEKDRFQPVKSGSKQAQSIDTNSPNVEWMFGQDKAIELEQQTLYDHYEQMLKNGVPKEVARLNTPVSRYSKMRAKTDLRNWLAFCNLRMRPNAQWEIRQYANAVGEIIKAIFPRVWGLFEEYDLYGCAMSRSELRVLQRNVGTGSLEMDAHGDGMSESKTKDFLRKIEEGGKTIL